MKRKKLVIQKATETGCLGTCSLLSIVFILPKHMINTLVIIVVCSLHCNTCLLIVWKDSSCLQKTVTTCFKGPLRFQVAYVQVTSDRDDKNLQQIFQKGIFFSLYDFRILLQQVLFGMTLGCNLLSALVG